MKEEVADLRETERHLLTFYRKPVLWQNAEWGWELDKSQYDFYSPHNKPAAFLI